MGFFKSLGKGLKGAAKGLTKVASFIPGSPVGVIGSGANAALSGKSIGKSIVNDLGRNSKVAGTLLPLAMSGGAAAGAAGAGGGGGGFLSGILGGGAGGALKKVGGFALDNPDLLLGGLSAWQAHQAGNRADKAAAGALDFARKDYMSRAPLREDGMRRILAAPPPQRAPLDPNRRESFNPGYSSNPFMR